MGNYIIPGIIILAVLYVIYRCLVKKRTCGNNCDSCTGCCNRSPKDDDTKD